MRMIFSVAITWKSAKACYHLQDDGYPVFESRLAGYDGPAAQAPPSFLLMVKSGDHWISDLDFPGLAESLGSGIEAFRAEGYPG